MLPNRVESANRPIPRVVESRTVTVGQQVPKDFRDASIEYLFPSPVMHFDWPESDRLNMRLKEIILDMQKRSAGVVKTNRGGWQSDTDLEMWTYPEIHDLIDKIITFAIEYIGRTYGIRDQRLDTGWSIRAWANVNEKGNSNRTHDHVGRTSFFSGIYYVDVGDINFSDLSSGHTIFEDWTYAAVSVLDNPNPYQRDFRMVPRNGRMVLFPAALMHSVQKYEGSRQRITIAFNLHHPGFAVPRLVYRERAVNWMWSNFRGVMLLKSKIPEKAMGLWLIPRVLASTSLPRPASLATIRQYVATAISHSFALASERFEKLKSSDR